MYIIIRGGRFYWNRFISIAPGYYIAIIISILVSFLEIKIGVEPIAELSGGGTTNFLLLHGFFPNYCNSIVRGGWYIGTTVVLYLLFPILNKGIILLYNKKKYFM